MAFRAFLGFFVCLALGGIAAPRAHAAGEAPEVANIEIDRIEIAGVTVFANAEIEEALEIGPGDRLERMRVVRTAENLQSLYRVHGYEEAGVKTRVLRRKGTDNHVENVLEFDIAEGAPTRVAEIRFVPDEIRDASFRRYWERLQPDLAAKVSVAPGSVFDQEKIASGKRGLQDLLASEEFIGAKIDDVRVSTVAATPEIEALARKEPTARWVALEFHIDLGDRVTFGFRGNTAFTLGHLSALIDEQRILGFGKDFVGAIKSRIEEEYHGAGYAQVKVTPYSFEKSAGQQRHVTFEITEGPRVTIEEVRFDGNSAFSEDQLRSRFYDSASELVQHDYYVAKDVQKAADVLVDWMQSKGYLHAKLVTINTIPAPVPRGVAAGSRVRLVIYVYEGDQTRVRSMKFSGFKAFSDGELAEMLSAKEGEPLNLFAFNQGIEAIKRGYRNRGYLGMQIVDEGSNHIVTYSADSRIADISLTAVEGPQYRLSRVQVEGLSQTHEEVVRRELTVKEKDFCEENKLAESEANIKRLGIFSQVAFRLIDDPEHPDQKILRISLQEGTPGLVAGGIGFRNDLGFRVFGEAEYLNLWGRNHTISLDVAANRRLEQLKPGDPEFIEYQAQLAYRWPWQFLGETTFRPAITVGKTQYFDFDATTESLTLTWERPILKHPDLVAQISYGLEGVRQFDALPSPGQTTNDIDNQSLRIGSITPSLRLDLRDNKIAPTSGFLVTVSDEIAESWLGSQGADPDLKTPRPAVSYSRFLFRTDYLWPVANNITWYFSFRAGYEINLTRPYSEGLDENGNPIFTHDPNGGFIPTIKQFALGGSTSLRGYGEQELNVQNLIVQGSASYVNYRTQLDLPFSGALRFGPFLDAANLNVDRFSFGNLDYGAGFGFHYQTPVGPVNLDWGFKLNPQPNTDTNHIYFSIGLI